MNPEKLRVAREKLTRVFRYLEALNQHRNPAKRQIREQLWSFWLHDLPDHPAIKRGGTKSGPAKNKPAEFPNGDTGSSEFVLKVQRPALSSPPEPPSSVASWLEAGWDDPSKEPLVSASRNESHQGGETRMANFADVAGRLAALQSWKKHAWPTSPMWREGWPLCRVGKWRAKNGPKTNGLLARR